MDLVGNDGITVRAPEAEEQGCLGLDGSWNGGDGIVDGAGLLLGSGWLATYWRRARGRMATYNRGIQAGTRESIPRGVQEGSFGGKLGLEITLHLGGAVVVEGGTIVESLVRG